MWKVKILVLVMECRNHSRALGIVWSVLVLLGFLSSHISLLYSVQPILLHMLPSFPASWAKHVHSQASIPNSWQNHKNLPHRYISLNISPPISSLTLSSAKAWLVLAIEDLCGSPLFLLKQKARVSCGIKPELHLRHLKEFSSRYCPDVCWMPTGKECIPCGPGPS